MEKQIFLLKENINTLEEKSFRIFDIQRKKIQFIDQKFDIIEQIWGRDDEEEVDQKINSTYSIEKWKMMIGIGLIFSFLLYFKIFVC
jgi:hypothetical protein